MEIVSARRIARPQGLNRESLADGGEGGLDLIELLRLTQSRDPHHTQRFRGPGAGRSSPFSVVSQFEKSSEPTTSER
jgi:hypothetical protein